MRLSENEVRALIVITRSEDPVHPSDLQKELGLLKGSISRIITHLQDKGMAERAGGEIILAGMSPAEAFKRLYYSHRASPLPEILSGRRMELLSQLDPCQEAWRTWRRRLASPAIPCITTCRVSSSWA